MEKAQALSRRHLYPAHIRLTCRINVTKGLRIFCNTRHSLWTRVVLFLGKKHHFFQNVTARGDSKVLPGPIDIQISHVYRQLLTLGTSQILLRPHKSLVLMILTFRKRIGFTWFHLQNGCFHYVPLTGPFSISCIWILNAHNTVTCTLVLNLRSALQSIAYPPATHVLTYAFKTLEQAII